MLKIGADSSNAFIQQSQQKQESLFEKLASGKKVNSAADDAAALQIIDRLTSEVEGNRQAISNVYDGISLAQVAEGGLGSITSDVDRIRELTLQSGSGALTDIDRSAIQDEISQLQSNISSTIEQTNFAGKPLLAQDGALSIQAGAGAVQTIDVETQDIAAKISDVLAIDLTAGTSVEDALNAADTAIETIGGARGNLGATLNRFESAAQNLTQGSISAAQSRSRLQDLDIAQASSELAANDVRQRAATTIQAQSNQRQDQVLALLS